MESQQIFIVCGARRTGTTLLAAVLSADESTPPFPGEAQLLPRWLESYKWAREYFSVRALPFFSDDKEFDQFYGRLLGEFLAHCGEHFEAASSIILKSPEVSLVFQEAHKLLPDARFLVTIRNPLDQVTSEWRVVDRRRGGEGDLRILRERDFETLARYYVSYYDPILEVLERDPRRVCLQRYEDLVTEPGKALEELERFTGLDLTGFDPEKEWPRMADSYWAYGTGPSDTPLYGKAIDPSRVETYLDLLAPEEARSVEEICASVAERLGYSVAG